METARDSIKYIRPVYSKTFNGKTLVDKTEDYNRLYEDDDPKMRNSINSDKFRKAIYESTEDRMNQELANALVIKAGEEFIFGAFAKGEVYNSTTDEPAKVTSTILTGTDFKIAAATEDVVAEESTKWGKAGTKYIDGYSVVYYGKETMPIFVQDKETKKFMLNSTDFVGDAALTKDAQGYKLTIAGLNFSPAYIAANTPSGGTAPTLNKNLVRVFGRYDSEEDFQGDYLGEVEIRTSDYFFEPRPTTIGVSWSSLSEIVLDTSFNVSAEEYLVTYASQAIRVALDYRAIKFAYQKAKTNGAAYRVTFDAAYNQTSNGHLEGYMANAQTMESALDTVADNMLNEISSLGRPTSSVCYFNNSKNGFSLAA